MKNFPCWDCIYDIKFSDGCSHPENYPENNFWDSDIECFTPKSKKTNEPVAVEKPKDQTSEFKIRSHAICPVCGKKTETLDESNTLPDGWIWDNLRDHTDDWAWCPDCEKTLCAKTDQTKLLQQLLAI